jgi:hypothetical protein
MSVVVGAAAGAGLALPAPAAVPAAVPAGRLLDVRDSGHIVRIGAFRPRQFLGDLRFRGGVAPTRGNAVRAYGRPDSRDETGCLNRWTRLGIRIRTEDFGGRAGHCTRGAGVQHVEVLSRRWATERGLRVGDSLDRVRKLYPELQRFTDAFGDSPALRDEWGLVFEPSSIGSGGKIDRLSATIRLRRVVVLRASPYGAGD